MNLSESVKVGLGGITTHKLRSFLTGLGIIFGVSAVIAMLSIGEGAKQETLEQIQLMGMNNIIIRSYEHTTKSLGKATANFSAGLSLKDAKAISEICPLVEGIAPQWENTVTAMYRDERMDVRLIGTTPEYRSIFNSNVKIGRFLNTSHLEMQSNVCVLGSKVKDNLFHFEEAVGKQIKLGNLWFTVIGVMEPKLISTKGAGNLDIRNVNLDVYIPLTTAVEKFDRESTEKRNAQMQGPTLPLRVIERNRVDQLTVKVKDAERILEAASIINRIISRRHYGISDFQVIIPEELMRQSQKTQRIFNIVMGAIASISLLVGGIGIMNIMLASVLERTREIGIRRSVGATKADILSQFLFEAVVLSLVGGVIGIGLGYGMTKIITAYAGWKTIVAFTSILLAFGVSAATGIAFGIYPAKKAAEKDPIESLRYE